jgi:hypothetical protein
MNDKRQDLPLISANEALDNIARIRALMETQLLHTHVYESDLEGLTNEDTPENRRIHRRMMLNEIAERIVSRLDEWSERIHARVLLDRMDDQGHE